LRSCIRKKNKTVWFYSKHKSLEGRNCTAQHRQDPMTLHVAFRPLVLNLISITELGSLYEPNFRKWEAEVEA